MLRPAAATQIAPRARQPAGLHLSKVRALDRPSLLSRLRAPPATREALAAAAAGLARSVARRAWQHLELPVGGDGAEGVAVDVEVIDGLGVVVCGHEAVVGSAVPPGPAGAVTGPGGGLDAEWEAIVVLLVASLLSGHPQDTEAYVLILLVADVAFTLATSLGLLILERGYLLSRYAH